MFEAIGLIAAVVTFVLFILGRIRFGLGTMASNINTNLTKNFESQVRDREMEWMLDATYLEKQKELYEVLKNATSAYKNWHDFDPYDLTNDSRRYASTAMYMATKGKLPVIMRMPPIVLKQNTMSNMYLIDDLKTEYVLAMEDQLRANGVQATAVVKVDMSRVEPDKYYKLREFYEKRGSGCRLGMCTSLHWAESLGPLLCRLSYDY